LNTAILHTEVQDFINENLSRDLSKLIFKGSPFHGITIQEIAAQIESKKKAQTKLPTWFKKPFIYYPNKLNLEQTSSEITANYKLQLVSGNHLIDLTGGFGVDTYYFSKKIKKVTHCEINNDLSEIVEHNYKILELDNIITVAEDGLTYLKNQDQFYDWIYVDPSRRSDVKGKVFMLEDCLPNIPENLETLFKFSNHILIKASPMLDLTKAINELEFVKEIHVVAVDNDVKELLFICEKSYKGQIFIKTVNHKKTSDEYFESTFNASLPSNYSLPQTYLYEPNSAILKAGLFDEVSNQLKTFKLHNNSHLYTLNKLIKFPGRSFKIIQTMSYNLKELKKSFPFTKANITIRNFPETVAKIRKKTKIKEGGDQYLFFTTDCKDKHIIIHCEKV